MSWDDEILGADPEPATDPAPGETRYIGSLGAEDTRPWCECGHRRTAHPQAGRCVEYGCSCVAYDAEGEGAR